MMLPLRGLASSSSLAPAALKDWGRRRVWRPSGAAGDAAAAASLCKGRKARYSW